MTKRQWALTLVASAALLGAVILVLSWVIAVVLWLVAGAVGIGFLLAAGRKPRSYSELWVFLALGIISLSLAMGDEAQRRRAKKAGLLLVEARSEIPHSETLREIEEHRKEWGDWPSEARCPRCHKFNCKHLRELSRK